MSTIEFVTITLRNDIFLTKDEWSNQGSGQWKVGEEDEWQEGGGDDFGDFGDFDEPEPPQPRQSEKVNYIYRNDSYTVGQRNDLSKDILDMNGIIKKGKHWHMLKNC